MFVRKQSPRSLPQNICFRRSGWGPGMDSLISIRNTALYTFQNCLNKVIELIISSASTNVSPSGHKSTWPSSQCYFMNKEIISLVMVTQELGWQKRGIERRSLQLLCTLPPNPALNRIVKHINVSLISQLLSLLWAISSPGLIGFTLLRVYKKIQYKTLIPNFPPALNSILICQDATLDQETERFRR